MAVEDFIQAMPKVALHVQLEGAFEKSRLLQIAEQNEIADELKRFDEWVRLIDEPNYDHLPDLIATLIQWLRHPEDLTHIAYELGVALAKQNVRYAEVHFNPILFTENNWTFDQCMRALNDGRDRAERGWGVQIRWILTIARDDPRHADEIVRWAGGAGGQTLGIVGITLGDPEDAQPIGQFERAFKTAKQKDVPRYVHAGLKLGIEGINEALEQLDPSIIFDGWGIEDDPDVCTELIENNIPLVIDMKRAICHQSVDSYAEFPLRTLVESGVGIIVTASMPTLYKTTLNAEYLAAVEVCELSLDELEGLALNAVQACQLPDDEKSALAAQFTSEFAILRAKHLEQPTSE